MNINLRRSKGESVNAYEDPKPKELNVETINYSQLRNNRNQFPHILLGTPEIIPRNEPYQRNIRLNQRPFAGDLRPPPTPPSPTRSTGPR